MNYRAYGITLASSIPLPELTAGDEEPLLTIRVGAPCADRSEWTWLDRCGENGARPWLSVGRRGPEYLLTFEGGADFLVAPDHHSIVCCPQADVPPHTVRHLVIDQVVPLVLAHLGRFVLHASAFVSNGEAVALLGRAGAGKSTFAASFGCAGAAVIADDALVAEREGESLIVTPAYRGVRLWPDVLPALGVSGDPAPVAHYSDKRRIGAADFAFTTEPMPMRRAYVLDAAPADTAIAITSLSRRAAFMELVKHAFVLDLADRHHLSRQCERLADDCAAVDVRRISYPDDLSQLPRVRAAILADLQTA